MRIHYYWIIKVYRHTVVQSPDHPARPPFLGNMSLNAIDSSSNQSINGLKNSKATPSSSSTSVFHR